jgi:hypothetical protein
MPEQEHRARAFAVRAVGSCPQQKLSLLPEGRYMSVLGSRSTTILARRLESY